jgi:cellulose biosynthesis protein BcsQ
MRLARNAVIPVTPDPLATHGANIAIKRFLGKNMRTKPVCVVISKYRQKSATAKRFKGLILGRKNPPVQANWPNILNTVISEGSTLQSISDYDSFSNVTSFKKKYKEKTNLMAEMAKEILHQVELQRAVSVSR